MGRRARIRIETRHRQKIEQRGQHFDQVLGATQAVFADDKKVIKKNVAARLGISCSTLSGWVKDSRLLSSVLSCYRRLQKAA